MNHGRGKSASAIVAVKPTNNAGRPAAEPVERRAETKGNADQQSTRRAQDRESVTLALDRIREVARQRKKERFTALFHHISPSLLRMAFLALKRDAAPGVDGLTWRDYEADLERNLAELHERVHRGAYRALPSRRRYIPKADGRQRPLAVAAVEDKIVQRAALAVLNVIYEEDFLGFSYGFRPRRSQHDALDALIVGISRKKVNYILDADIRFGQPRMAGPLPEAPDQRPAHDPPDPEMAEGGRSRRRGRDGQRQGNGAGFGNLAAACQHLPALRLRPLGWALATAWRHGRHDHRALRRDLVVGFEHENDARRFWDAMRERLQEFVLTLHSEKTRLLKFGRYAAAARKRLGLSKPETFAFLGFTFISGKSRGGAFLVHRKTRRDRMSAKLKEIKEELQRRMHRPIPEQGAWLRQVVSGFFAYHAVPTNFRALLVFHAHVKGLWYRTLRRRSQKDRTTWDRMLKLAGEFLPQPRILHPWPNQRFDVNHPR
jgi:RNA-directed DNA polymerase